MYIIITIYAVKNNYHHCKIDSIPKNIKKSRFFTFFKTQKILVVFGKVLSSSTKILLKNAKNANFQCLTPYIHFYNLLNYFTAFMVLKIETYNTTEKYMILQ